MTRPSLVIVLAIAAAVASCKSAPPASAPQSPGSKPAAVAALKPVLMPFTKADVDFMQGMIGHHAQALEMTALLYTRTNKPEMKLLAERIDVSQGDEIKMMKRWLEDRKQEVPSEHAHHMGGALMPGMLTAEQMTKLGAAKGDEFDRLFLEAMIYHHFGAIDMVEKLLKEPGAAQQSEMFDFASHVDGDQRMEIARMRAMLKSK